LNLHGVGYMRTRSMPHCDRSSGTNAIGAGLRRRIERVEYYWSGTENIEEPLTTEQTPVRARVVVAGTPAGVAHGGGNSDRHSFRLLLQRIRLRARRTGERFAGGDVIDQVQSTPGSKIASSRYVTSASVEQSRSVRALLA
jgi:hypothetical protein